MPRLALTKVVAAIIFLTFCGFLVSCSSNNSSSGTMPPPNIAGSWEFIAVSSSGAQTGIEVQLTEGQALVKGVEQPDGQIGADSAQMAFVNLTSGANQTTNISGFGGSCSASPTTANGLSGTVTQVGAPINFTFTANGSVFTVAATLSDSKTVLNGTYTPQAGNACSDPGGTISGLVVSVPTGQYTGQMCSPIETSCSSFDDTVTATVTAKSGQLTLNLLLSGADNTTFTPVGPYFGNAFTVQGTFQGQSITYYGYFEQVYNSTLQTNVQSIYLVNAADPCFQSPGTTCTTATVLQVPQTI